MKNSIFNNKLNLVVFLITLFYVLYLGYPSDYYFLNDDFVHIPQAASMNFMNDSSFVRPLSNLSLWLDYIIWGKNSFGYHLTNLVIHFVNVVLVFCCSKILFKNFEHDKNWLDKSLFCCTLFLVYAYHSESLFWIIGRGSSLTTLFFLSAFICFLKAETSFVKTILCLLFFYLGLFTYELIWVFPMIITLHHFFYKNTYRFKVVILIWMAFLVFLSIKFFILDNTISFYELGALNTFNINNLGYNFNTLIARIFIPPLSNSIVFLIIYSLLIFTLAILILKNKENRILLFSFSGMIISILPAITLGIDTHDTESERFIYLSTFFAIILIIEIIHFIKVYKWLFFISLLSIHFYFFREAAKTYKTASLITKESLKCINTGKKNESLHVHNLPSQYKGALIFRTGFENAVKWMNSSNYNTININSRKEVFNKKVKFNCVVHNSPFTGQVDLYEKENIYSEEIFLHKFNDSILTLEWNF